MPFDASGSAVCSFGTARFSAPDSGATLVTIASTPEDPVVPTVAEGAVADSFTVDDNYLWSPSPPTAVIGSPACCRAPGDSRMGSTGIPSAPGPAFGCSSVWTSGTGSVVRLALHQISLLVTAKVKKL